VILKKLRFFSKEAAKSFEFFTCKKKKFKFFPNLCLSRQQQNLSPKIGNSMSIFFLFAWVCHYSKLINIHKIGICFMLNEKKEIVKSIIEVLK